MPRFQVVKKQKGLRRSFEEVVSEHPSYAKAQQEAAKLTESLPKDDTGIPPVFEVRPTP